jgi:DNA-binding HxlR family transcriptional regulator
MTSSPDTLPGARDLMAAIPGRPCPAAGSLALIGEKWALLAVREIFYGNHRFSDIVRNTGAPRDRMAARLKSLVEAGILEKRSYSEHPPRSEYHLTPAGLDLASVVRELVTWGERWVTGTPAPLVLRHHEHVLRSSTRCEECGERVGPGEVTVEVKTPGWSAAGPDTR